METIKLVEFQAPFKPDKDIKIVDYHNESLLEIKGKHFGKNFPINVSLNGAVVSDEHLESTYLKPNDCVIFSPMIEGDDSLRLIAGIALTIVAIVAAPYIAPYLTPALTGLGVGAGAGMMAKAIAMMGIMLLGGLLINTLLPMSSPKIDVNDISNSSLYSWNPQTTQGQGIVIPKIYGTTKATGNIISTYIESVNKDQYLHTLISLGYGPIKDFLNFYVNDQPVSYLKGVEIDTRYGLISQPLIKGFEDTKVEYPQNVEIKQDQEYIIVTTGNAFDALEIELSFPYGLYYANDEGGLTEHAEEYVVEVAPNGTSNWQILTSRILAMENVASPYWSLGFEANDYKGLVWNKDTTTYVSQALGLGNWGELFYFN